MSARSKLSDIVATMFRGRWCTLGLVVAMVGGIGLAGERTARADDALASVHKAIDDLDYATARTQLTAVRDAGGLRPEDLAELYKLTGVVNASIGDAAAATDAFGRWLALAPKASFPAGTSPKIMRPFTAAARASASRGALEVKVDTAANPPVLTVIAVNDPLHMVARARVVFTADGGGEQTKDVATTGERTPIALPAAGRIDARVAALDDHGNHLIELGSKEVPIVIIGDRPPPVVARAPGPSTVTATASTASAPRAPRSAPVAIYRRWWPYAAAAVVFGGGSGYFAYRTHVDADDLRKINTQSSLHTFAEAKTIEDRGHRDALITNIGVGVAGAFAIAAGVLYVLGRHAHTETQLTAVPVAGGATFVLGGAL
jgi:hypothetical protein